ncbi:MAG: TIR domain-containing protein [Verrucomicrobiota bacterium]
MSGDTPYSGESFRNDVFVSYSHGKELAESGQSHLKLWSDVLISNLKEYISVPLRSADVKIWNDGKLPPNSPITDTIKEAVEGSAILVVILTDSYLRSDWCKAEREWFASEVSRRGGGSGLESVFVIRATNIEHEKWPDFLKDESGEPSLGINFCDRKSNFPYGFPDPNKAKDQGDFYASLSNLGPSVARALEKVKSEFEKARSAAKPAVANRPIVRTVYVAPGTEDVRGALKSIREKLTQRGIKVAPSEMVAIDQIHGQVTNEVFGQARAFVQCFGYMAARTPEMISRVERLHKLACEQNLPRFLWRDSKIDIDLLSYDLEYKNFIQRLVPDIQMDIDVLVEELCSKLQEIQLPEDGGFSSTAYMEIPSEVYHEFDRWRKDIQVPDCVVFPLTPPQKGGMSEISKERRAKQLIYEECNVILHLYCVKGQLKWMRDSIINSEKVKTRIDCPQSAHPTNLIVDYTDETDTELVAQTIGVPFCRRREGEDSAALLSAIKKAIR